MTVDEVTLESLEEVYRTTADVRGKVHAQAILLLAKGYSKAEVGTITGFGRRWLNQLVERFAAGGVAVLGDRRRGNAGRAPLVTADLRDRMRVRLATPPDDGGLWTGPKVAIVLARELGLPRVHPQRGWDLLKAIAWSIQVPRPSNPREATPEEAAAFKKNSGRSTRKKAAKRPTARSTSSPPTSTGSG